MEEVDGRSIGPMSSLDESRPCETLGKVKRLVPTFDPICPWCNEPQDCHPGFGEYRFCSDCDKRMYIGVPAIKINGKYELRYVTWKVTAKEMRRMYYDATTALWSIYDAACGGWCYYNEPPLEDKPQPSSD